MGKRPPNASGSFEHSYGSSRASGSQANRDASVVRLRSCMVRLRACIAPAASVFPDRDGRDPLDRHPTAVIDLTDVDPPESTAVVACDGNVHQEPAPDNLALVPAPVGENPYALSSRDELVALLQSRDADINRLSNRVVLAQAQARQTRKRHRILAVKKNTSTLGSRDGLAVTRRGKRRLTCSAMVAVALRRNLSNISSQDCVVCSVEWVR